MGLTVEQHIARLRENLIPLRSAVAGSCVMRSPPEKALHAGPNSEVERSKRLTQN